MNAPINMSINTFNEFIRVTTSLVSLLVMRIAGTPSKTSSNVICAAYLTMRAIQFTMIFIAYRKIRDRQDSRIVRVPSEGRDSLGSSYEEVTYSEYDRRELTKMLRASIAQIAMAFFAYFKWGNTYPLVPQCIAVVMLFIFDPVFKATLFGAEIKRPYSENMLFENKSAPQKADGDEASELDSSVREVTGKDDEGSEEDEESKEEECNEASGKLASENGSSGIGSDVEAEDADGDLIPEKVAIKKTKKTAGLRRGRQRQQMEVVSGRRRKED